MQVIIVNLYLKRLELCGFKSFSQKTVLEFPRGISVIVGPNGSGKSNLADAIRWALGEQSMKNIRASKADEVIFSGTPQKAPAGLAQVSIYFDNSDKFFPDDSQEIVISRKLYRNGDSEYLLNKNPVRLKDITIFLAKARLGVHGFCVVGQGAADAILQASSKEKRSIIEEALGLKEFRLKKNEAERKIEETKINLDKVLSMLQEIAPHLRYLKRQVNKFEKRIPLEEELKKLQKIYFGRELSNFSFDWKEIIEKKENLLIEFQVKQENLKQLEELFRKEEEKTPQYFQEFENLESKINQLQEEKNQIARELGKIEGLIEAENQKISLKEKISIPQININHIFDQLKNIKGILETILKSTSLEEIKNKIKDIDNIIENIINPPKIDYSEEKNYSSFNDQLKKEKTNINQKLELINQKIEELNKTYQALKEKSKKEASNLSQITKEVEKQKNELRETENFLRDLELTEAKFKIKEEDLKNKIKEAGLVWEEVENFSLAITNNSLNEEENNLLALEPLILEEKIFKIKRELGEIGTIDEDLMREYKETEERYNFLQSQSEDLKKAIDTLHHLILELEEKINKEFNQALIKINEAFNRFFQLMFGGGNAKLIKTFINENEENEKNQLIKEEVLEVKVDLPRKKIKSLDMLSGGERAITSIALLFGIIATSPPPFLVLDEIDAALDEANSLKFSQLLKDLSRETQFILITHNRQTMNAANILYGVTMENEGVSRLLSLKLEEAEEIGRQYKTEEKNKN